MGTIKEELSNCGIIICTKARVEEAKKDNPRPLKYFPKVEELLCPVEDKE